MSNIQVVKVALDLDDGSKKVYHFKNSHEFIINKGDRVTCKVKTGGTATGKVVGFGEPEEGLATKNIVEVHKMKKEQEPLLDGNEYVCDIRIWRNQWSSDDGYEWQWSDLIKTCLYDESEDIKIGSIVSYQDTDGRVVNLRQVPKKKTLKMERVHLKPLPPKKKGFFSRLFGR